MSDFVELEPWQQEALNGNMGIRAQAEVIEELESQGIEIQYENDEPEVDAQQEWVQAMQVETGRLERNIGRPLTRKEFREIADGTTLNRGATDLVAEHADRLKGRAGTRDGRDELAAEEIEDANSQTGAFPKMPDRFLQEGGWAAGQGEQPDDSVEFEEVGAE